MSATADSSTDYESLCPYCGARNNAVRCVTGREIPKPGDVFVCFYCAGVSLVTSSGVRVPTEAERAELLEDSEVMHWVGGILTYRAVEP